MSLTAPATETRTRPRCCSLRVRGQVQGVGFRPTVWRLARELGLCGEVLNDGDGVLIHLAGDADAIAGFPERLRRHSPPLARIDRIETLEAPSGLEQRGDFRIVDSRHSRPRTGIVADAATCPDCLAEVLDSAQRRHRHAFANCTHCGPRLSIVRELPYDRAQTSMAGFALCADCAQEYRDPADRRFHAQPIACPNCGPKLWLCDRNGEALPAADAIDETARRLRAGEIVAIKGVGGFQLACNALDETAIEALRRRKYRPHKPLALMMRDLEQVRRYCRLSDFETAELASPAAPILLLRRREDAPLPEAIAPGLREIGVMLPNSPLHHLLLRALDGPIVLTSGNAPGEPQCTGNRQALERLGAIADAFLMHDRDIVNRVDDSVARCVTLADGPRRQWLRRARGVAPTPLPLPPGLEDTPPVLACGGEMKNTFCLLQDGQATLSQHIGDLKQSAAWVDYREQLERYLRLWQFRPEVIAIDAHPQYLTSQFGREQSDALSVRLQTVQHHHAHVAACLADNGRPLDAPPVIGIALDGLGLGDDGSLWGGELLIADYRRYRRAAHLRPVPLPGGVKAMLEPWRNAWTHLHLNGLMPADPAGENLPIFDYLATRPLPTLEGMLRMGVNAPLSSSCGRLFDAVAALLGLRIAGISYEGQAAIELEQAIGDLDLDAVDPCPLTVRHEAEGLIVDPAPLWPALLDDLKRGIPRAELAARFHAGLVAALVETCRRLREREAIDTVALCGGVMQNARLLQALEGRLRAAGFTVLTHRQVPANDGGLSLGQAVIAAARTLNPLLEEKPPCVSASPDR